MTAEIKRGAHRLSLAGLAALVLMLILAADAAAATGTFERAWGKDVNGGGVFGVCTMAASCQTGMTGGLGGEMSSPTGVATDASGNVYVVEQSNQRVQKFDSAGNWLRAWGKDVNGGGVFGVCTMAASCQPGLSGVLAGEMNNPYGIATDASGNVYVGDQINNRVQKFDSSGNFLRAWGRDVVLSGQHETAGDDFEVCVEPTGSDPDDVCKAGTPGEQGGEMVSVFGVAADSSFNVYVSDFDNNRIQQFSSSGTFQRAWGKDVDMVAAGTGFEICTVAANCKAAVVGLGFDLGGEMTGPAGLSTDSADNVYVGDRFHNRIQVFDSSGNFLRAWGKDVDSGGGTGFEICTVAANCQADAVGGGLGGEMTDPQGVAVGGAGDVYVAEFNRVQRFDTTGDWKRAWGKDVDSAAGTGFEICTVASSCLTGLGTAGTLGGEMNTPIGLAAAQTGEVYVGDRNNHRVQKFTSPPPALTTQATATATLGGQISDQATLAGGTAPGGTITFASYGPNDATCANPAAYTSSAVGVLGNGVYNNAPAFTPTMVGTYRWRASYTGDADNGAVAGACNDPNETSVVNAPVIIPPIVTPPVTTPAPGPTGQRAAALKKCKKKRGRARRNCKKKANQLPV